MRLRIGMSIAALIAATLAPAAPAQAATPAIMFTKAYYDSPGSDTGSNASLNAEYVRIKNTRTTGSINLEGWKIRDVAGHTYTFGAVYLKAGSSIYLHTGKGTNTSTHKYWGRSWYVWNNTGDTAWVKNRSGTTIDKCSWSSKGSGYTFCN